MYYRQHLRQRNHRTTQQLYANGMPQKPFYVRPCLSFLKLSALAVSIGCALRVQSWRSCICIHITSKTLEIIISTRKQEVLVDSSLLWQKPETRQIGGDVSFDSWFLGFQFIVGGRVCQSRVSHHGGQKSDKGSEKKDAGLAGFSFYSLQGPTCGWHHQYSEWVILPQSILSVKIPQRHPYQYSRYSTSRSI